MSRCADTAVLWVAIIAYLIASAWPFIEGVTR